MCIKQDSALPPPRLLLAAAADAAFHLSRLAVGRALLLRSQGGLGAGGARGKQGGALGAHPISET